jgi:hypothetical protein
MVHEPCFNICRGESAGHAHRFQQMPIGRGKAGCGYFFSDDPGDTGDCAAASFAFPRLDDFYFDALMPSRAGTCSMNYRVSCERRDVY